MKNRKYLLYISSVLILISGFSVVDEPGFLKKLKETLGAYNASYPEEKVYVQLDKPFYKPGEDIWFNVFVLNSNTNKPTNISDVVYVELIDPKGNVTTRLELVIKEGTAHGDFALGSSVAGGLYKIKSYTQWMKNYGRDNYFQKEIQVQRIITPRLLLKMDHQKESYGAGEMVSTKLTVTNLKNEKVPNATIDINVRIDGTTILTSQTETDIQGEAIINFQLPDTLTTTDGLLLAVVRSEEVEESISRSIPIVLNKITVQFFPEGGTWLQQVNSNIAFKALNEFGKAADISGSIIDDNNTVVAKFASFHMGMGAFTLKPSKGVNYYARIDSPSGKHAPIQLPAPMSSGFVLNLIDKTDTTVRWLVHSPSDTDAHLVGQAHGEIFYSAKINLRRGENLHTVSTNDFPSGIAVFTLFDGGGIEHCERLVFLNKNNALTIKIKSDKQRYLPREKVQLDIRTVDSGGKPTPAKISLAVIDDQLISFADDRQDNLLSAILLSSEVRGEIQEPTFYFDPNESKSSKALDYLLMTQGWRRFSWKDVFHNNRKITYSPEKNKTVGGVLKGTDGAGISGEVTLLEVGGGKRIVKVRTTKDGHFVFKNIDPTIPLILLAKKPGEIVLKKETTLSFSLNDKEGTVILRDEPVVLGPPTITTERIEPRANPSESGLNMSLESDVTQLSEVVVTAFGIEEKRAISGSITRVEENGIETMFANSTVENSIQGRVAGVIIQPQSGNPASQSNIVIRGISSLAGGRCEPLYVIDGHPIGTSLNQNFSNGSMLGPDEISTIEVINSPEASALYGSSAANGAILITTRSRINNIHFQSRKKPSKYSSQTITPRSFSRTREFYVPPPTALKTETRTDFRTTVYWNHTVVTNESGEASISFYNNDAVSAFRITAEGVSRSGLLGRTEETLFTELPLSLDVKFPMSLGFEDVLQLPVRIKNETSSLLSGKLELNLPLALAAKELLVRNVKVEPKSTETVWFTITSKGIEGDFPVSIKLKSGDFSDEMKHIIHVTPIGFPVRLSFSSKNMDSTFRFSIVDAEQNTVKAELTAFPDILSDLFTGAESILREPHGCFEQVSSSTFPNILALQFLKQSGLINSIIEERALSYIKSGYKKLNAYEIKGGGFEWFGHPPAHEGLTAYGLLQFHEMKKVFNGVDEEMMNRTRDWLLSRRTGRGAFRQNAGKYGFSAASSNVTNAYITYALSETGTKDILPEYYQALAEVTNSKDMYRAALVANTAFNLGKLDDYNSLVNRFKEMVRSSGFTNLNVDHSIVRSYGNSLQVETISLWTIALLKVSSPDLVLVDRCIHQIMSYRSYGQFGSTQGTTLALKALTEYANLVRTTRDDGEIQILVANQLAEKFGYKKESREKLTMNTFTGNLTNNNEQVLTVRFTGTREPLPYSIDIQYHTKKPMSNDECKVTLTTSLNVSSVRLNETVRLTTTLSNRTNDGLPMTVASIGIPAGLSVQPWQLKELQEKEVFDFYEIEGGNLVLYYREIAPNGKHIISLDLKAEIPGSYTGSASSAYLYYTNEYKDWFSGNSIEILK